MEKSAGKRKLSFIKLQRGKLILIAHRKGKGTQVSQKGVSKRVDERTGDVGKERICR